MHSIDKILKEIRHDIIVSGPDTYVIQLIKSHSNREYEHEFKEYKLTYSHTQDNNVQNNLGNEKLLNDLDETEDEFVDQKESPEEEIKEESPEKELKEENSKEESLEEESLEESLEEEIKEKNEEKKTSYKKYKKRKVNKQQQIKTKKKRIKLSKILVKVNDPMNQDQIYIDNLVDFFKKGYSKQKFVNIDHISKQDLIQLNQRILENTGDFDPKTVDHIQIVINSGRSLYMLGRYFMSVVVNQIKTQYPRRYTSKFSEVFTLLGKGEPSFYINLYNFIQKYYKKETSDISLLIKIPIFNTALNWQVWKDLLTKPRRHIVEAALKKFNLYLSSLIICPRIDQESSMDIPILNNNTFMQLLPFRTRHQAQAAIIVQ